VRPKWFDRKAAPQTSDFPSLEAAVRRLISSGKHKTALDQAKDLHKGHGTAASEALLLDAYAARIQSLMEEGLNLEATALISLVQERFPAARDRLQTLTAANLARSGKLDELLAPLKDPSLTPERQAIVEQAIQEHVPDPTLIAACPALPAEHPLRQAATALQRAFTAVTTRPVSDEMLALPEVSRRSPLAPWKMLVGALAYLYRRDREACRRYLAAIPPGSAPARLVPIIEAMDRDGQSGLPLTPAGRELLSQVKGNADALKRAALQLDEALDEGSDDDILQAIRKLVPECRRTAPSNLDRLKQYIAVRGDLEHIDRKKVNSAMGGPPIEDAAFLGTLARNFELDDQLAAACLGWHDFRDKAVKEGWLPAEGPEMAAIYLHIAGLLGDLAPWELRQIEVMRAQMKGVPDVAWRLDAAMLYERAGALDPHPSVFSKWLEWAKTRKGYAAQKVAEKWRQARPRDIEPLLYLISAFEKRNAFPTALRHLAEAEQIDGVNPNVRKARLRLMSANLFKQLQQKTVAPVATKTLAAIAEMPQTRQGDRPAFVQALHYMLASRKDDAAEAQRRRAEVERLLGSAAAASLLIHNVARACKRPIPEMLELPKSERGAVPSILARVGALAGDVGLAMAVPFGWVQEASKQFANVRKSLDLPQLRLLGEFALRDRIFEFAYDISAEGLARGVHNEAEFLLLRAQALQSRFHERAMVCALAAASVARQRHEFDLSAKAVDFLDEIFKQDINKIEPAQIEQILKTEKAETCYPKPGTGPTYRDLLGRWCDCPDCRQARGEQPYLFDEDEEEFDEDEEDEFDEDEGDPFEGLGFDLPAGLPIPKGMPPELAKLLFVSMMEGRVRGETPHETVDRLQREMGLDMLPPRRGKKRR
jgi:hypothetical protein